MKTSDTDVPLDEGGSYKELGFRPMGAWWGKSFAGMES